MYLNIEDLKKGMLEEDLDAVSRDEINALQAIIEASAEVESYLCARYDIKSELSKQFDDETRITMVVKLVRDIALFNCCTIATQVNMTEIRVQRYEDAIKFLRDCQAEKASIPDLQRLRTADGTVSSNYISYSSSSVKRNHHI
jgi:phage gp36-like protein